MSAEIIILEDKRRPPNPGNGAREALMDMGLIPRTAEWFLMEMWSRGFKIVPIDETPE